jgi:hypothetical protein
MRRIILSSIGCLAPPYLPVFSHNWHDIQHVVPEHKMCVLVFSTTLSATFLILSREITTVHRFCVELPLLLAFFCNKTRIFWTSFRKIFNIKFHENPSSGSRTADRQTGGRTDGWMDGQRHRDTKKLIVASDSFANSPKTYKPRA